MKPYRLLDLFSGIGGFSLGLERSGAFKTVAFCEIDLPTAFAGGEASIDLQNIDEDAIRQVFNRSDLQTRKAKPINVVQTPTPNAERHSDRAMRESNHA